jgi:4'-phosphopantetheinyl transferase
VNATLFANAPERALRAGVVHVWRFACSQDAAAHAHVLSGEERAIAARFATQALHDAYVAPHALVRLILARYVQREPHTLAFTRGPRGKPQLEGVEFNLAHCEDVALLAVARTAVGVDIERVGAVDTHALRRLVLAPDEQDMAFMRVWCRKEACLKATGVGLVDDLTSVSVARDAVAVADTIVHVQDLELGAGHAAALATAEPVAAMSGVELETISW